MTVSRHLQNVAALLMLSAFFAQSAYSQKILPEGVKDLATQIAASAPSRISRRSLYYPSGISMEKPPFLGLTYQRNW